MATNAQRIASLEQWRTAHRAEHAAIPLLSHAPPEPPPSTVLLDTRTQGWGLWRGFNNADYGLDSDFIDGQVTDLGTGKRITAERQQSGTFAYVSGWLDTFGTFAFG